MTLGLSAEEGGSDGSDASSSSAAVVAAVVGSGSWSELLGFLGGNTVASYDAGGPNCVAKTSAGSAFGLVGAGLEGSFDFATGRAMVVSIVDDAFCATIERVLGA